MEAAAPMLCVNTPPQGKGTAHADMATKEMVLNVWALSVE